MLMQPILQWMFLPFMSHCFLSWFLSRAIVISFALQEYWMDFDEICGSSRYQQQIKWLHFGRNCNRDKGTEYNSKFESILACVLPWCQTVADA